MNGSLRGLLVNLAGLAVAVAILVAVHHLLRLIATEALFLLIVFLPILFAAYAGRFHGRVRPQQFVNVFVAVALAGVLLYLPAVTIVAVTALLALGLAWLSARSALSSVSYDRSLVPPRLFPGDEAELRIRLRNEKLLPLAWIEVTDPIHLGPSLVKRTFGDLLRFSVPTEPWEDEERALVTRAAVAPFGTLDRVYQVTGLRRGVYTLGPAEAVSGDVFGLFRRREQRGGRFEIVVYPRVYRADEIGLTFRQAMGEVTMRRALHEDPILLAGSREYRPGDPLRRVHWKATARTGDLQVRVHDPSTTAQLMIILNLNSFQHLWQGVDSERMEAAISTAASLAVWAVDAGFAVGLRSNGSVGEGAARERAPRVAPSAHQQQSAILLEHLARLAFLGQSAESVLIDESRRLGQSTTVLFVTPIITPPLVTALSAPPLAGRVSVVYCGRFAAPVIPGLPIHLAIPPLESVRAAS
jgi:uncharacterized protein (DUF58 family)